MSTDTASRLARIAALNDRCRCGRDPSARIVVTRNCLYRVAGEADGFALILAQYRLLTAVQRYAFTEAEKSERDRGTLRIDGQEVRFRIDCYDQTLEWGSPDPADPEVTTRVLTIMLPEDD